jgi:hypothetical protein
VASGQSPVASLDPARYGEVPVVELLRAASRGFIGIDRRLIRSILERGESAASDVLAFSREPLEQHRIDLEPLLVDLFRHYGNPEALDFFIDAARRSPEEVDDELIQALLPFGEKAVGPLLDLYEELGEEQGIDVAFLLAGLRVRDPRVLAVLLDRLEFDAADGAFCLGLYGDPAARPALEKMLAEIPEADVELRREIQYALEMLDTSEPTYQPELFDILAEYPERDIPAVEVLSEAERLELLSSSDPDARAVAAHSFFNIELDPKERAALLALAKSDPDARVRGRAWASLADATEDAAIRDAMIAVLNDPSREVVERGGAAVGLYGVADREDARAGIEALYEVGGAARAKALEAMWRSLWKPYAKFFPSHLDDPDREIARQAVRGAGYFQLTRYLDRIASYFDRDDDMADLRDDALFAYALAMPGETTRGRIRAMLRKIDGLADLSESEVDLVKYALDERLQLHGLDPVFATEGERDEPEDEPKPDAPLVSKTVGRNDPCPCGSGKKYKKCHGA